MSYVFKIADTEEEYAGIRRLNHAAFAAELGQHEANESGLLRDRFEEKSRYFVALESGRVVGMIAFHDQPPYSIEERLSDPSVLKQISGRKIEVRLLAIHPEHRNGMVLAGLLGSLIRRVVAEGYEILLISGLADRLEMYRRFGFRQLGPPVVSGKACFVPMVLRLAEMPERILAEIEIWKRRHAASS